MGSRAIVMGNFVFIVAKWVDGVRIRLRAHVVPILRPNFPGLSCCEYLSCIVADLPIWYLVFQHSEH